MVLLRSPLVSIIAKCKEWHLRTSSVKKKTEEDLYRVCQTEIQTKTNIFYSNIWCTSYTRGTKWQNVLYNNIGTVTLVPNNQSNESGLCNIHCHVTWSCENSINTLSWQTNIWNNRTLDPWPQTLVQIQSSFWTVGLTSVYSLMIMVKSMTFYKGHLPIQTHFYQ
jgi:hypothetical protein